jgi:hypothetical protein
VRAKGAHRRSNPPVADLEPGGYEIRFLSDDGYLLYAVSEEFVVVP